VRVGARVDPAADLRHPEFDAVVHEHWERETELVAVEGARRLADHHGIERASRILERF
jgi:hypothetical protein